MKSDTTFTAAYDRELPWLWEVIRRLGVEDRDVADAVHDVFVVAWHRRDSFEATRPLRPWLYGIACRLAANRRARHSSRDVLSEEPERSTAETPEGQLDAKQTLGRVQVALAALDDEKRQIFVGHDIEAFPMPELTQALGVPLNTGYSRLRLARAAFEKAFREERSA